MPNVERAGAVTGVVCLIAVLVLVAPAWPVAQSPSGDCTQWRGPGRDGVVPHFIAPAKWPKQLTHRCRLEMAHAAENLQSPCHEPEHSCIAVSSGVGSIVADRARGLKMKVVAFDPFLTPERAIEMGVEKVTLDELLARADFITLHTPLTDQTRNILSAENLAKTKKGVRIINCARGGLIDEAALKAGLDSGHIAGAALDVFVEEPAKASPLFNTPNFISTPHLGASTTEAQVNVAIQVAEQMADFLMSGGVTNALNVPSLSAEEAPRLKPYLALA